MTEHQMTGSVVGEENVAEVIDTDQHKKKATSIGPDLSGITPEEKGGNDEL